MSTQSHPTTILRRKEVEIRTGLSRSSIYAYLAQGDFPSPINLGPRAVGWLEFEVEQWLAQRIKASREVGIDPRCSPATGETNLTKLTAMRPPSPCSRQS